MANTILKTEGISKKYGSTQVLNNVSITLESGRIYGLIGVNGAGKTTLMRQILGLSVPTSGEIELFGKRGKAISKERSSLGCLIESPGLVLNLTAKQNLHLHRIMHGIADADIEDKLLETVGLAHTGKKKAKDFSVSSRCIACGQCTRLCPKGNIRIVNGRASIGTDCIQCLRCLQFCPEEAITIGSASKKREHYHNPAVRAADLMEACIHID